MRLLAYLLSLNILLLSAVAVEPTSSEIQVMDNWIRASFYGEELEFEHGGYLEVKLEHGPLLKNMATTKVYHKQLGDLPLKIKAHSP